jgi:hypothetical protein
MLSAIDGREAIGHDLVVVVDSGSFPQHPSGSGRVEKRVDICNTAAGNSSVAHGQFTFVRLTRLVLTQRRGSSYASCCDIIPVVLQERLISQSGMGIQMMRWLAGLLTPKVKDRGFCEQTEVFATHRRNRACNWNWF